MNIYIVYEKYHNDFLSFAKSITKNYDEAFDLVQDAYLAALEREEMFEFMNEYQIKGWFFTTIKNKNIDNIRKKSRLDYQFELDIIAKEDSFEERISNIEVLGKLIILESLEEDISQYIDNYYSVNKELIPNIDGEIHYIGKDVLIDNRFLEKYNEAIIYIDGNVSFNLEENTDFGKHIKLLLCKKITCKKKIYDMIKGHIGENVNVEIMEEGLRINTGHMVLTGKIGEEIIIQNMGKLNIGENLDIETFSKNVVEIRNYGLIVVPEDKLDIIKEKVKVNRGVISSTKERQEKAKAESKEEILYENMGELKL